MRILSIDGGGIRGIIPAVVLAAIEERCGKRIAEMFDVIAGTSTGAILTCALARPGADGRPRYRADELIDLYTVDGPKIFHRSLIKRITSADGLIDERYDNSALRASLREHLGDTRLKDTLCDVFATAYALQLRDAFFFRSRRAKGHDLPPGGRAEQYDYAMADVALASASAPTYFEPVEVENAADERYALIDGGVFANNPAMCAYAEWRKQGAAGDLLLVSLGTGAQTPEQGIDFDDARGWGQIEWARPLIDVMFDGIADTVGYEMGQLLPDGYVRLQAPLGHANEALDDASESNIANLRRDADELVRDRGAELDALCERLSEER
jgi:patatin-like phospholipase/acyl hydrolase